MVGETFRNVNNDFNKCIKCCVDALVVVVLLSQLVHKVMGSIPIQNNFLTLIWLIGHISNLLNRLKTHVHI